MINHHRCEYGGFTGKASLYDRYRPSYSKEYLNYLTECIGVKPGALVADIGAGTGIHSAALLKTGCDLVAVEPNSDMASICRKKLGEIANVIERCAEDTGLPADAFDYVTMAQAFHLVDPILSMREFARILRPSGRVILTWNSKDHDNDIYFAHEEAVIQCCPLYRPEVHSRTLENDKYVRYFVEGTYRYANLDGDATESLDLETFIGRTMSASYAPPPDSEGAIILKNRLTKLFDAYCENDRLSIRQSTIVYSGEVR